MLDSCFSSENFQDGMRAGGSLLVSRSQTAIFSFILGREKIGSGTPPIEKAVLASTAIGVGDYWQWLLCNR